MMETFELLRVLCGQSGVPGREAPAIEVLRALLDAFPCETDPLGGLHVLVRAPGTGEKTLMLEAHADRVGLVVTDYAAGGFLRLAKAGGVDEAALMGARVRVRGRDGEWLPAVIGAPFPHPAKPHNSAPAAEYKMPAVSELWADTGLTDPAASIARGAEVLLEGETRRLAGRRVAAPALDNRAGCAALVLAAKALADASLGVGVRLLFSSREEIGGAGARAGAFGAAPDYAVVVDTGFALSPDVTDRDGVALGQGPEIDFSAMLDAGLYDALCAAAQTHEIPHQTLVLPSRSTGTDADGITTAARGVRTALLSIPIRFMHHPVEVCDLADIENTAALLAAFAKEVR